MHPSRSPLYFYGLVFLNFNQRRVVDALKRTFLFILYAWNVFHPCHHNRDVFITRFHARFLLSSKIPLFGNIRETLVTWYERNIGQQRNQYGGRRTRDFDEIKIIILNNTYLYLNKEVDDGSALDLICL